MNMQNDVELHEKHETINLYTTLGRIEAKLNTVVDMENRVRALESWRALLVGGWSILTILVGAAFALLLTII